LIEAKDKINGNIGDGKLLTKTGNIEPRAKNQEPRAKN
jgi:hypothetical protein